jgi:hypothetical protein
LRVVVSICLLKTVLLSLQAGRRLEEDIAGEGIAEGVLRRSIVG